MDLLTDPTPRDLAQRRKDFHDVQSALDADAASVQRRADDLLNYVYGVVEEGAALDPGELEGYVESLRESATEVSATARLVGAVADEDARQRKAREHVASGQ